MVRCGAIALVVAAFAFSVALLPLPAAAAATGQDSSAAALDLEVVAQLNQIRVGHGLVALRLSTELSEAALAHTRQMVEQGYFAHNSADGEPFWQRIRAYYPNLNFSYWSVGENLLWSTGSPTAAQDLRDWMASPPHRANILDPGWRQIGIAVVTSPDAPGAFRGLAVTVITTDFGVRR
jgi:uncharacterized protein YkwD